MPLQLDASSIAGTIKNRPSDFVVDEIPLYESCGDGEHLYIGVQKTNVSHEELIRSIAREYGVKRGAIGYAGRKDLHAVTSQVLSVHHPSLTPVIPHHIGHIEIKWCSRHSNKLRLGHLLGNRFTIRIRDVDHVHVPLIQQRLQQLSKLGLPNAFGPQRFGILRNNHKLGLALVMEDWDQLIEQLLMGEDVHHKYAKEGDYQRAFDAWSFGQPSERNVLELLAKGKSPRQACMRISKSMQKLWVNALQSKLFNAGLAIRIKKGTWDKLLLGDLAWNHKGGGRTFLVSEDDIDSEDLQLRVASIDVSPSGPMWSAKMRRPTGDVLQHELEVLESFELDELFINKMRLHVEGTRRPLRVPVMNTAITDGIDDHGQFVEVRFELPAGSYATVVIEKLLNVCL